MSKSKHTILLLPGETGWQIWTGGPEGIFTLAEHTAATRPGDLSGIPSGDLTLFFPVRAVTTVPMRVTSDDASLYGDLITLHAERLGLRPDPMAGQLTDHFVVGREGENTALCAVFLRTPGDGDLPARGPGSFDISPRAYHVSGNTLAIWRELGRWVFAHHIGGKLLYSQSTAIDSAAPNDALTLEIRLALSQLAMQGMESHPSRIVVWSSDPGIDVSALASLRVPVEITPRPSPAVPDPISRLLPADVRAARRTAARRRNITMAVTALAFIYLGIIGWLVYGLWQKGQQTRALVAKAESIAPDAAAYSDHIARWDELTKAIDLRHSPVDILSRIASCIPPNSGLRLTLADISADEITLRGEAPQFQPASAFSLRLNQNNELSDYTWETPAPSQAKLGWDFTYKALNKNLENQP